MKSIIAAAALMSVAGFAHAATITIEPDNYADGTALTNIVPGVTLNTVVSDGRIVPIFTVTSDTTSPGYSSTGTKGFAYVGTDFWWQGRRLRMDFGGPASSISIDAIGGTNFSHDIGILEAYNAQGSLLETYATAGLAPKTVETMFINRPAGDIAYAVAYAIEGPEGYGPFLRLDHLVVDMTPIPEPASAALLAPGLAFALRRPRRR